MKDLNFMNMVNDTMNRVNNVLSRTENGAVGYKNTNSALLDMNFKISSYRNMSESQIIADFDKAYNENKDYAMKFLFYVRDVLQGAGERRTFRIILKHLATENKFPEDLIKQIPAFGRYDDLFELFNTSYEIKTLYFIRDQLKEDVANYKANKPISLLAKWLPSVNTSSKKSVDLAYKIANALGLNARLYRKTVAALRSHLNIVERKMAANDWNNIDYSTVASKANANYKDAFLKHDFERRTAFLGKAVTGEVKVNAKTLAPYEIVHKYSRHNVVVDTSLEVLWKNLPTNFDINKPTMVVADGSGSMSWASLSNTKVTALEVANALAIYFAERNIGPYKNKYITFSSRPQYVDFSKCVTLRDKIHKALEHDECSNTNIEAVFNLVLDTAIRNNLKQEQLPAQILILSDMEFDGAQYNRMNQTLFQNIANKYARYGYRLPKLVFWNICGRTNTVPVKTNEMGVILVSGFSSNVFKMVMSNKTDPYEALIETLNNERYSKIHA